MTEHNETPEVLTILALSGERLPLCLLFTTEADVKYAVRMIALMHHEREWLLNFEDDTQPIDVDPFDVPPKYVTDALAKSITVIPDVPAFLLSTFETDPRVRSLPDDGVFSLTYLEG